MASKSLAIQVPRISASSLWLFNELKRSKFPSNMRWFPGFFLPRLTFGWLIRDGNLTKKIMVRVVQPGG